VDAELDARIAEADLGQHLRDALYLGHHRQAQGRGAVQPQHHRNARRTQSEFDKLRADDDILAYLPMAWVGDFIFSVGQAYWTGFCVNCPESPATMMTDLREIGPTYFFAPPRVFETQLTSVMIRMEDASRMKKWLFDTFMAMPAGSAPTFWTASRCRGWTG
jgi:long-chain acyl-CoA synthetase